MSDISEAEILGHQRDGENGADHHQRRNADHGRGNPQTFQKDAEKGTGAFLPERPSGCCAQKAPVPFSAVLRVLRTKGAYPLFRQPPGHEASESRVSGRDQ